MPRTSRHCNRLTARPRFLPSQPLIPAFIDSAFVPPRAALVGSAAVRQLAEDFRHASQREGGACRDDLKTLGWTGAQLDEHGPAANIRAQQLAGASL